LTLFLPVQRFRVLIKRRKGERIVCIDRHPAIRMVEPPPCDWGLGLERARLVCDEQLHLTDASGQASLSFTAGSVAGKAEISATVGSLAGIVFTQQVVAASAALLAKFAGDGAAGLAGAGVQVVVKVTDSFGNAVSGITVSWAAGSNGGTLNEMTSTSDAAGLARDVDARRDAGVAMQATSGVLPAVTFSMTTSCAVQRRARGAVESRRAPELWSCMRRMLEQGPAYPPVGTKPASNSPCSRCVPIPVASCSAWGPPRFLGTSNVRHGRRR
jgi:hypothetical protein